MYINSIKLRNFKCYKELYLEFDKRLNVLLGINGTGKTSLLEALRVALGSIFLKVDKYQGKIECPGIDTDDVRLSNLEAQYPVVVDTTAHVDLNGWKEDKRIISWERSLETKDGATRYANAKEMQDVSEFLQRSIREANNNVTAPLVAYYSTDRFKKEKRKSSVEPEGTRLRGYFNALDAQTNTKFFSDLYYTETLDSVQNGAKSKLIEAVNEAVLKCIDCDDLKFDLKKNELLMISKGAKEGMPLHLLSDGVRSVLSMVMEIASRCFLLNPHLGANAAKKTPGVILIDEIDLHLHPEWQLRIVGNLIDAFPLMQFIVTTHAPLVVRSVKEGRIYSIKDRQVYDFPLQYGRDSNYILNEMDVPEMDKDIKTKFESYLQMIETGNGKSEAALNERKLLENMLGVSNPVFNRADLMLQFF